MSTRRRPPSGSSFEVWRMGRKQFQRQSGKERGFAGGNNGRNGGAVRSASQNSRFHGKSGAKVDAFSGSKEKMFGGGKQGIKSLGTKLSKGEQFALSGKKRARADGGVSAAAIPGGKVAWDPGSRRQRRKDEKTERKRAKLEVASQSSSSAIRRRLTDAQLTATEGGGNKKAHDSDWGKGVRRQRMLMMRAQTLVDTERARLTRYIDPAVEADIVAREQKEDKRLKTLHQIARRIEFENDPELGYIDPGSVHTLPQCPPRCSRAQRYWHRLTTVVPAGRVHRALPPPQAREPLRDHTTWRCLGPRRDAAVLPATPVSSVGVSRRG